jgi:transcriptional regulator with XRE-family HTH domain
MKIYTLADWLRDRLRERTLSQRQLARQTGIATGTISTTLHGHVPRPVVVQKLAEFFDADAGTVLEIAGFLQLSDVPGELPAEIKDIVRRLYRLPTRERNAILKQVNQLLDLLEDRAGPPA